MGTLDALAALGNAMGRRFHPGVELGKLRPDPNQPRKHFDEEAIAGLAENMKGQGVLEPLLIRPGEEGTFWVIAGERRFRAAEKAGLLSIPCLEVDREPSPVERALMSLSENLMREDLTLGETANAVLELVDTHRMQKVAVARAFGKKGGWVTKQLAIARAEGPLKEAVEEGLIRSAETGYSFGELPPERQRRLLQKARADGTVISRAQVDAAIEAEKRMDAGGAAPKPAGAAVEGKAPSRRKGPGEEGEGPAGAADEDTGVPEEDLVHFVLSRAQAERLFARLGGGGLPKPASVVRELMRLVDAEE